MVQLTTEEIPALLQQMNRDMEWVQGLLQMRG